VVTDLKIWWTAGKSGGQFQTKYIFLQGKNHSNTPMEILMQTSPNTPVQTGKFFFGLVKLGDCLPKCPAEYLNILRFSTKDSFRPCENFIQTCRNLQSACPNVLQLIIIFGGDC
jgi:hypothetical protein